MLEDGNPDFSVVYRTIPTSNHNVIGYETREVQVVYRTIPTSNHNLSMKVMVDLALYIVLFLHQTTTTWCNATSASGCISYYSYIKPQLSAKPSALLAVVYRTIPTSNHNHPKTRSTPSQLYIVLFLHQTTTLHS